MGYDDIKLKVNHAASRWAARLRPFYREFPYEGPMGFFKVDPRGAYSPADKFFYNRVPKAANTTITHTLTEHSSFRRKFSQDDPKDFFLRPSYLTKAQVRELVEEAVKFTFVRDPYSRTLSAYSDKILRGKKQLHALRAWLGRDEGMPSFTEFCRFLDATALYDDMHWAPQTEILLLPLERFDFVGRVEQIDTDLPEVMGRIFGAEAVKDMVFAGTRTDASHRLDEAYGDEESEIVTRLFACDFAELGYPLR